MGGMVVAPQVPAVETGVDVLRNGGNAIDAAVTAAFVQMVVDPQMCGIGGFGAATVRTASGEEVTVDFNGTAGSKATPEMWQDIVIEQDWTGYGYHLEGKVNDVGYGSIMTPGTVAGMAELLDRFGTISWKDALQAAIRISDAGYVVSPELWRIWNMPGFGLHSSFGERLKATEPCRAIYFKEDGSGYLPGERFMNPDHTRTLQRLADGGPREFYEGGLAQELAADLAANGSFITAEDMAGYQVRVSEPIRMTYRGQTVLTNPPAGGGICMAQTLKIIEHEDIAALGLNSVEYIDLVGHAMKAAYHDWYAFVADPAFVDVPVEMLLSDERADEWYAKIKAGETFTVPRYPESPTTTNISVMDEAGNAIALTHSLGASSGVVSAGHGFTWNNIMNTANPQPGLPNSIAPGKARITGMCPTIVLRDGEVVLTLGAPGGTRIITGVLQALLNVLDHGLSPVEAVSAPRFDCQGETLDCEARIPSWTKAELADRGFKIWPNPAPYGNFALVQAITRDPATGKLRGGADPRGGGAAMGTN
ncbi:MAG TPA: gamma-glutamyltransferase [Thermomicrobiales bacterium]|nr:gamma-glutamyltransferase [Thermomicrobiales bacterium]